MKLIIIFLFGQLCCNNTAFSKSCLGIIPVVVKGSDGNTCRTYALLDDGADKTLCDKRLLKSLNISSRPNVNCELHWQYHLWKGG